MLAGLSCKLAVPHLLPGDLVALSGRWPVPSGSRHGLRKIMPGMTTKIREQQALKAISLTLGSGGNGKSVPVCTISAMLCFWNEHKSNVLQWVREWVPAGGALRRLPSPPRLTHFCLWCFSACVLGMLVAAVVGPRCLRCFSACVLGILVAGVVGLRGCGSSQWLCVTQVSRRRPRSPSTSRSCRGSAGTAGYNGGISPVSR